jgi:lipopolysaccharide/colanic/teichoic acid biosynthesis glycosyltransferase
MLKSSNQLSKFTSDRYPWLDRFNPDNRIFTGKYYHLLKRFFDVTLVILASVVTMPVGFICAILIKFESPRDPIIFKQCRTGKGGNRFMMYKFRTMVANAEELIPEYSEVNEDGELKGPLKIENDPRVTFIGRILRKTSLDELPQLINVLKGEMSLIGPRPTSWGLKSYELWHTERLDVLPGISGLWQICDRGENDFDEWLRWDILYLKKRSLMLDFEILMRTIMAVFKQHGAR